MYLRVGEEERRGSHGCGTASPLLIGGLLQFLDGEVLPLTVGDLIGCLICRGHVEDGVLHLTKGYATIVERVIIAVGGEVYLGHSTKEDSDTRVLIIAVECSATDLLHSW